MGRCIYHPSALSLARGRAPAEEEGGLRPLGMLLARHRNAFPREEDSKGRAEVQELDSSGRRFNRGTLSSSSKHFNAVNRTTDISSLVQFGGTWSTSEAELIGEAAVEAERAAVPALVDGPGGCAPWISTCQTAGTTDLYTATRVGTTRVFVAKSAPALADKIRRFAQRC